MNNYFYDIKEKLAAIGGKRKLTESVKDAAQAVPGYVPDDIDEDQGFAPDEIQLDELSPKTLGGYVKKAAQDSREASYASAADYERGNIGRHERGLDHSDKRQRGIERAVNKLAMKESGFRNDMIRFSIDSEKAYEKVLDKFGDVIDWDEDVMTVPPKYWSAIQELAHDFGGEANEEGSEFAHDDLDERAGPVGGGKWQDKMHLEEESDDMEDLLSNLRKAYGNIEGIDPASPTYTKLIDFLDNLDREHLQVLADAGVKFVSMLAKNRLRSGADKLNELSKDTLKSYKDKSRAREHEIMKNHEYGTQRGMQELGKRVKGQMDANRAVDRLTRESYDDFGPGLHDDDPWDRYGFESMDDVINAGLSMLNDGMPIRDILNMFHDEGLVESDKEVRELISALKNKGGSAMECNMRESESTKHPAEDQVRRDLAQRYGEANYKSKATGATHQITDTGKGFRCGMMKSQTLSGLLHLIDEKVNNRAPARGTMHFNESDWDHEPPESKKGMFKGNPKMNIGDTVEIIGRVQFNGERGTIKDFGRDNRFVVVDLGPNGVRSFQSSNVSLCDDDEFDESSCSRVNEISKNTATKYIKKASAGATDFGDVPEKRKAGVYNALKKKHGGAKVPATEGYRVIPSLDDEYEERAGLEGPFNANGRPIYYDPKEGKYWDPKTDFYLDDEESSTLFAESFEVVVEHKGKLKRIIVDLPKAGKRKQ